MHFGVLGMRWGRRKAQASGPSGAGSTARKAFTKTTDVLMGKAGKAALARDVATAKNRTNKLLNNKIFKALVYNKDNGGFIRKDMAKADMAKAKAATEKANGSVSKLIKSKAFKTLVYNKDTGGFIRKDLINKDLSSISEGFKNKREQSNRNQYQSGLRDLARLKAQGKTAEAKALQEDLDSLFTPEEKKRYS